MIEKIFGGSTAMVFKFTEISVIYGTIDNGWMYEPDYISTRTPSYAANSTKWPLHPNSCAGNERFLEAEVEDRPTISVERQSFKSGD